MWQRVANVNGKCRTYVGVPLGFTKEQLIQWVMDNPPPLEMKKPSIDRIENALGYVPGNIRWLEQSQNSRQRNKDLPIDVRACSRCHVVKPITDEHFPRNTNRYMGHGYYCHDCNRVYQRSWRSAQEARQRQ